MSAYRGTVLVVDDDLVLLEAIEQWLSLSDFKTETARSEEEALEKLPIYQFDAVLSDIRMPGRDGMDLLRSIRKDWPDLPVILLTGHGDIALAVAALKQGAFDFLTKPHDPERLVATLRNACEQHRLRLRLKAIDETSAGADPIALRLIGYSAPMRRLQDGIRALVNVPLDVLVNGETGSGKEVVARTLHECGSRRSKPFVAINCAAIPAEILESELFGHEAGAFTGAHHVRIGKFEFANGGTVFLDEIESMPATAQAKLLRVLQERAIERVGSNKIIAIDVRIVSAAKSDLRSLAEKGIFRDDLYYRLAGYELVIPPLRSRGDDILHLFMIFASAAAQRIKQSAQPVSAVSAARLLEYSWPGNVRELRAAAERYGLGFGLRIGPTDIDVSGAHAKAPLDQLVAAHEKQVILATLASANWSISEAISQLGIPRRTLNEKMRRFGIVRFTNTKQKNSEDL